VRVVLSNQAEIDLEEIGDYIAADNPVRAVSFVREMRGAFSPDRGGAISLHAAA